MSEVIRSRDCTVFYKAASTTVAVSSAMVSGGWAGGQGVQWVGVVGDDRVVTYSEGIYGGFLIWGSDELGDDFTAITRQQPTYRYATMLFGDCLIATSSYEKYTYASRVGGSPVPLVYQPNDILMLSRRGLWTKEDELTIVGSPLAPAPVAGYVAQTPKEVNRYYLGIQVAM